MTSRYVSQYTIDHDRFDSLLAPGNEGTMALSLDTARNFAALHHAIPDGTVAIFDPLGERVGASQNFDDFFAFNELFAPSHADDGVERHRHIDPKGWLAERKRFARCATLTRRPVRMIELAAGCRVESLFLTVEGTRAGEPFVLQTSRRVIRCHRADEPLRDTDERAIALHATWGILDALSMRQLQVLRLVTRGYSNDRIGSLFGRTKRAIEWHIRGLFARLKVDDRVQLTLAGMRAGLDDIPDHAWNDMLALRFGIDHERRPSVSPEP